MSGPVRSLNLSTAVGIVLYEAMRQIGMGRELRVASRVAPIETPGS
jgi:tRNA C32,U32 (ribose-2'-O)-methylase TrmJ